MESWRMVWREGVVPLLSTESLEALRGALIYADAGLVQGVTTATSPGAWSGQPDWLLEGACALGYCGWKGEGLETAIEVEEFFTRLCCGIDERMGEPAACRWFLHWFDDTPQDEMRRLLLPEVNRALAMRHVDDVEIDCEDEAAAF